MRLAERLAAGTAQLAPRDADFLYNECDGHPGHLLAIYFFDTAQCPDAEFSQEQAIQWVTARLGHHRMFTHRIRRVPGGLEHPYWEPAANFDIRDHVRVTPISEPGWSPLHEHLGALLTTRMDLSRPPWEMHFYSGVEGLDICPGRSTAVVLKAHHSAGDGLAVLDLAQRLFSEEARPSSVRPAAPLLRGRMLAASVLRLPAQIRRFAKDVPGNRAAGRTVRQAQTTGEVAASPQQSPATRFNGKVSGSGCIASMTLPRQRIRGIKAAVPGATVNDVLLAAVGGGLARYLSEKAEPHGGSLVAMVPRSMRTVESWESANQVVVLSVDMHTDVADPLERVARIARSSQGEKRRSSHVAVRRLAAAMETAPPPLLRSIAYTRKRNTHDLDRPRYQHTMVSNMPFAVEGLTLNGAPAVAVVGGQPPVDGDGLRHFVVAAADGGLTVTVMADPATMPDVHHYLQLVRESFADLVSAAGPAPDAPTDRVAAGQGAGIAATSVPPTSSRAGVGQ